MSDFLEKFTLSKSARALLENKIKIKKDLSEGKTIQQELEFSDETIAKFYSAAYHMLENKKYQDASNAFFFLITLNPDSYDDWMGLGISTQLCGHYEEAVDAYEMGAIIKPENPIPYFYLAKCFFAMHEKNHALQAIDLAIEYANEDADFFDLKQEAIAARNLLSKDHTLDD